jgi:hypothetical protein
MKFGNLIKSLYDLYIKNEYDDVINIAYNNIGSIKDSAKTYAFGINTGDDKNKYIDYQFEESIDKSISKFDDDINNLSLFRQIVHELIKKNQHNELTEAGEINSVRTKIKYHITISDTQLKTKLFMLYLVVYYMEARTRKVASYKKTINPDTLNEKPHVGVDYEFNNRIIALMQLNFETYCDKDKESHSYIWLVSPGEFDDEQNKILIKYLMTNLDIYKILHGPDSLDIPYMYNIMFKNDIDVILAFTKKMIDTRFLCEYMRQSIGLERKCNIYSAIKYFGTISEKKYDNLEDTHDAMGPVQDINWNIHKLSSYHIMYGYYDVLFLKFYVMDIYKKINEQTPELLPSYKFVNPIIRFVILDRREAIDVSSVAKEDINPIHNYMIRYKGQNFTLITIFNEMIENFKMCVDNGNECVDLNFLLLVGFLRKGIMIILKQIMYYVISQNYTIFKKKNYKWDGKVNLDSTYGKLKKYDQIEMLKFFDMFKNESYKRIMIRFPRKIN